MYSASGNASAAASTDIHTSTVASQELPGNGKASQKWALCRWPWNTIPRLSCPGVPVAYVLILDGLTVAAEVTQTLDPSTYLDSSVTTNTSTSTRTMENADSGNMPQYWRECWTSQAEIQCALVDTSQRMKGKTCDHDQEAE